MVETNAVIPAKAGIYEHRVRRVLAGLRSWIPDQVRDDEKGEAVTHD